MATMTQHAVGSPSWFELASMDQEGAKRFYGELFGWTSNDYPIPDSGYYTIFSLGGREVAALYTLTPEQQEQSVPAHWDLYFKVLDCDVYTDRVRDSGGTVMAPPFEVMDHLRMSVLADPEGAGFCLAQPRQHPGVGVVREVGAVCWVELATRDLARAEFFYTNLFRWHMQSHPGSPTPYRMFSSADGVLGGLMAMDKEWGDMPSHWSLYFQVEDVDATVAKAEAAGGKVRVPAFDAPGVGRIARIDDPSGAGFYVIRLDSGAPA